MRQFVLDLNLREPYEAGAQLLALICFPAVSDEKRCASLRESLCVKAIEAQARADGAWANSKQPIRPRYLLQGRDVIDRDWNLCVKVIGQRLVAAKMIMPFLKEAHTGETPKLPGVKKLSLRAMANFVLDDLGQNEVTNVVHRVWRPAVPVIHICAALAIYISERERAGQDRVDYGHILFDVATIRSIVDGAVYLKNLMKKAKRLPVDPDKLVGIALREKRGQKKRRS